MIRVGNLEDALVFFRDILGLVEVRRKDSETGRFSLVFLAAPKDLDLVKRNKAPVLELTYNWDSEEYHHGRSFGHLAYEVDDIYAVCDHLIKKGVQILRPPKDGYMAFIKSPDGISIELLQSGEPLAIKEPLVSMPNVGAW